MSTIFTKIIEGDIPSYKIAENELFYAFLDINPITKGHVLVVSKKEEDYFFNLDDSTLASMVIFAKKVAKAMKKVINCKKIGLMIIGLEIPHVHIHLIPISKESDIYFNNSKKQFVPEQFKIIAESLKSAFEN
ncbi:MAG: HIT family protein [Candidatus Azobacteroides pseudotrichonymphae]|jgi:histidine triad (HIT) family protein|nr:HIT family protein [Bacteroidales bacterium OttesenSCG-928-I14]GMO32113.1 MAG: HIT family protein [Candidatus Azobacteroides pseudotrichonymphae]